MLLNEPCTLRFCSMLVSAACLPCCIAFAAVSALDDIRAMVSPIFIVDCPARFASSRISCAITLNPSPCLPAWAASIAAFSASRFVCCAIERISPTIRFTSAIRSTNSRIISTPEVTVSTIPLRLCVVASTDSLLWSISCATVSVRSAMARLFASLCVAASRVCCSIFTTSRICCRCLFAFSARSIDVCTRLRLSSPISTTASDNSVPLFLGLLRRNAETRP